MNKLSEIINNLSYDELKKIERDLTEGHIEKLLKQKINQLDTSSRICPVCYKEIKDTNEAFILTFGPPDFRKKASFCALDCLEFFINQIKNKEIE